jgi:NAD(P)-dependent dehydrogenase (short-subunit alcohol dehydrogenase family)
MPAWTAEDIPSQSGQVAIVTGASSGIGAAAAEDLAAKGAEVVLAVRNQARGDIVRARILGKHPGANVSISLLDLADIASIRAFAERTKATQPKIDILLNNAGLGMQAARAVTKDGFERQLGTNHLGHFALTGLLVPALLRAPAPRVVTIASIAHKRGQIDFANLQGERAYAGMKIYAQSKLANLMFALELDARARAASSKLASLGAHPGIAATGFLAAIGQPAYLEAVGNLVLKLFGQDSSHGALPGLYAATMPDARGGQYWGPDGFAELRGAPALAKIAPQAKNIETRQRLWTISEELTGVSFPPLA